ncbi:uncharacterized protein LOC124253575 isoform X2 [Haliotis rubra]|uniref:uncharacterized protein LOC124253575 isoform X2 n=1 Tax=Haliotis rubra TaxID=36100 RepID=UPI001EE5E850|nr:uncharacterized protein LOC124253575 isoform X2 [Haliotis rubra]
MIQPEQWRNGEIRLFPNISCVSKMLKYLYLASFVQICCGQAVTTIDSSLPQHVELYSTQRISCDIAGTLKTGVRWIRPDAFLVSTCAGATNCLPNSGYSNPVATTTRNVLEIANTTFLDAGSWICRDGADGQPSRGTLIVMKNSSACVINSTSNLDSLKEGSQVTIMFYIKQYYCSSPSLFQLGNANVTLPRTPSGLDDVEENVTISVTQTQTLDLYMVCEGVRFKQNCDVTITIAPEPDEGGFPLIAVIILAILLVGIIVTDVLFVLYRWGGFFTGISVQKVYILYWSCFVQGIVDCVFGVIFFIVTCAVYTERLDEPLATGTLALSIIVIIIGAVNIFLCCRCYKSPGEVDGKPGSSGPSSNAGGPRPWLCCCCPQSKICSGEESRQSPPAPIPAAMASPRKPVPPNSTSARPLPSPTSDPASDSAVNPKVLLEPLNVEEPKKKKKRRKKRKSTKEAGEESAAQTMTAAGDSDDD